MTKAINPAAKEARLIFRTVVKETEGLLDKMLTDTHTAIRPWTLQRQVALNAGLPISQVENIVTSYIATRSDLYIVSGKSGGIRRRL